MAQPQNYKNHIRWYAPHHFVFYPAMCVLFAYALFNAVNEEDDRKLWAFLAVITAVIIWVAFMVRQHYALTLQNRIVLMELRYRYFAITGQRLELLEDKLSEAQLFALRFAPDSGLPQLLERAIQEKLSPDAIKKAIEIWQPDNRRV